MKLSRRQLLMGSLATGLAACGRPGSRQQSLELWTLQLAPKFNDYFAEVLGDWRQRHPAAGVRWTDLPWGSVERKLLAAVYARMAPDVVNLNPPFAANLASKGGLMDLTPLLPQTAASAEHVAATQVKRSFPGALAPWSSWWTTPASRTRSELA